MLPDRLRCVPPRRQNPAPPPGTRHAVALGRFWRTRRAEQNLRAVSFVGRGRALSRLLASRSRRRRRGRARLVLVGGEAGIGKTTLIGEAVARSGWAVGWGTCADAERAPAFWAWTTALRGLLAGGRADGDGRAFRSTRRSWPGCSPSSSGADRRRSRRSSTPTRRGCGCSTRSPGSWSGSPGTRPRSSCSTTCSGPTRRRSRCCGSSRGPTGRCRW